MSGPWKVRSYLQGDENGIMGLFRVVYRKDDLDEARWQEWWSWQHKANPAGRPIIRLADTGDSIAGQYEVIRIAMKVDGWEGMASHSQDTMTHPDFRRQGIFETLAKETYREATEGGLYLVYGFPNRFSRPGMVNKLHCFDMGKVPNIFKPINVRNTFSRRIRNPFLLSLSSLLAKPFFKVFGRDPRPPSVPGLAVEEASSFDEGADDLWKEASKPFRIIAVRDKAHLNWRYVDIPHRDYTIFTARIEGRLVGFAVLGFARKPGFTGGEIIDLFGIEDERVLLHLLARSIGFFKDKGADAVYCWKPSNKTYLRAYRRSGFFPMPPDPPFVARSFSKEAGPELLRERSNWFLTMGDSDFH